MNCIRVALKDAWMIIDDTDYKAVRSLYDELTANGTLLAEAPPGWSPYWRHDIARIP
jgi:hypothetical protein